VNDFAGIDRRVTMSEVTQLLAAIERGESGASDQLFPVVYEELRMLARAKMRRESAAHTLDATALVHEAYLRLIGGDADMSWKNRGHFFGAAAEAMRRVLIDNARRKQAAKRGASRDRVELDDAALATTGDDDNLLAIDQALQKLAESDPKTAELVKLRYFAGLSLPQIAEVLDMSQRSVERLWTYAKAWFQAELGGDQVTG
jgi:RNA polymerase sigma factor (TIGR02999 family)